MASASPADVKFEIGHVLFIDVVGYSKLLITEQREQLQTLNEIVRNAEQFSASDANGMLVRIPTGDGMALIFRNSLESPVRCAVEISRALRNHPEIRLRIGIHSGPVSDVTDVNERANIAGAGIDIAQRVMDCGDAGHILLSKRVADDLAPYPRWNPHLHDLGECEVKHGVKLSLVNLYTDEIGNPQSPGKLKNAQAERAWKMAADRRSAAARRRNVIIGVATLVVAAFAVVFLFLTHHSTQPPFRSEKSIAVLPFQDKSTDADTEYLSEGIQEALINSLTELQQLKVIARTTASRYKGRDVDPEEIGRQLKVGAVLMGAVRQTSQRLNVQVDLVDTTTGAQLWGEEFERKVSEVLSIKQTIVREVTEKLRLRLSDDQQQRLVQRDTTNPEAYRFYLRGRYYWNKRTAEGLRKGIEEFQHAIDRDPAYALGYVGLADCYALLEEIAGVPSSETLPKARAAIDRALQIDDSSAEAHTSSALIYQELWRWEEAEVEYKRAITLNQNYPTAHQWFSNYLFFKRQFDDALREGKRAQELDPLSPIVSHNVTFAYLLKNDLNSAIEEGKKVLELAPNFPPSHYDLGWVYLKQRRYEEATAEYQNAVQSTGNASESLSNLGYCYAVMGKRAEALAIVKELEERCARRESIGYYPAGVWAGLGDKDQAFAWLERDFQQHSGELPSITFWISFESLRGDPRYADLVRRMRLEP